MHEIDGEGDVLQDGESKCCKRVSETTYIILSRGGIPSSLFSQMTFVHFFIVTYSVDWGKKHAYVNVCNIFFFFHTQFSYVIFSLHILYLLQIASMGLTTALLIVLTMICSAAGNCVRLKKYFSLFWLAPHSRSPTQKMCQRLGTDPDCCLPSLYDHCHMNVYLCKRIICLYLNVRAYVYIHAYPYHIGVYTGAAQTVTTANSG